MTNHSSPETEHYPNADYDNWAEEIGSLKATLSMTRGIVAHLEDELKKARSAHAQTALPPLVDRAELIALLEDLASVNLSREACARQARRMADDLIARGVSVTTSCDSALEESVKLQSHYAELLNMHDGGKRRTFANAQEWIDRLSAVTSTDSLCPDCGRAVDGPTHAAYCAVTRPNSNNTENKEGGA